MTVDTCHYSVHLTDEMSVGSTEVAHLYVEAVAIWTDIPNFQLIMFLFNEIIDS